MKYLRRSLILIFLVLASCAAPPSQVATNRLSTQSFASPPTDRPGLGTKWGETRTSRVTIVPFERADRTHPIASATIYYNNSEGIRAMAGAAAWERSWPILPSPVNSLIQIGLKDQSGRFLPGLVVGDRWFAVGEEGRRNERIEQHERRHDDVARLDRPAPGLEAIRERAAGQRLVACSC